jgi:hypothetical protein
MHTREVGLHRPSIKNTIHTGTSQGLGVAEATRLTEVLGITWLEPEVCSSWEASEASCMRHVLRLKCSHKSTVGKGGNAAFRISICRDLVGFFTFTIFVRNST